MIKNPESEESLNNEVGKNNSINKSTAHSHRRSNTVYSSRGNKIKNLFHRQSSKFEFTFSDQADSSNQNYTSSQNNDNSNLAEVDYLKQFRNLNEFTNYFSSPDNLDKTSHDTMQSEELISKNSNTIQHFENYNFNNKVFEIRENIELCLNPRADTTNKPKSNWNLIKAIFNLVEELDKSQLIYLSEVISKRLNRENADNN